MIILSIIILLIILVATVFLNITRYVLSGALVARLFVYSMVTV